MRRPKKRELAEQIAVWTYVVSRHLPVCENREEDIDIDANTRAIFGRSYAAEPDVLVKELAADEAIKAADTLLLTIPNQLGVDYNAHVLDSILKYVAPELGWR